MRNLLLLFTSLTFSCNYNPEPPIFKKINSVEINYENGGKIHLTGNAVYENPNNIKGKMTHGILNLSINDVYIGKIDRDFDIEIPAKDSFNFPFEFRFKPDAFVKHKGLLGTLGMLLEKKELKVHYEGTATVKILEIISRDIPFNQTEMIKL